MTPRIALEYIPKWANHLSILKKLLSGNLSKVYPWNTRRFATCQPDKRKLYFKQFEKLQNTLKDVNLSPLLPLKDVVSLYSEEYDKELYNMMESEILTIYHNSYPQILKISEGKLKNFSSKLAETQSALFSGGIHRMSDCNKVILQVAPGVGGEESSHFAEELFSMYKNISEDRNFEFVKHPGNRAEVIGGTNFFKYEFGVHRVQRIPFNSKRIQTSSAVVTVVPHFDVENIKLKSSDLVTETMRSSGPGGQSVNKSETAVRVVHVPSGISVSIRDTSSQIDNKAIALEMIVKRIREKQEKELEMVKSELKSSQFKTGDRSEKIRTFNFMHDTIVDHRCKVTLNGVEAFLDSGRGIEQIHNALSEVEDAIIVDFMVENIDSVVEFYKTNHKLR